MLCVLNDAEMQSVNSHVCLIPMWALSTLSGCLLLLMMLHTCDLFYSLLSASTSFAVLESPYNALDNYYLSFYWSWNGISESSFTTSNNINDKINDNYLPILGNLLFEAKELKVDLRLRSKTSGGVPSPEFAPPLKDGSLHQGHSMISPAVQGERFTAPARHSVGVVFTVTQHLPLISVSAAMVMVYYC